MKVENKIGSSNLQNVESTKSGKLSSKLGLGRTTSSNNAAEARGSSKVDLSERAQLMQRAKEIASQESIDEAKVARLQKLIDEGKYKTDASAIADRLVDEHMHFPD